MSSEISQLKEKMAQIGLSPRKKLGQNFLVSSHVIQSIVECLAEAPITTNLVEVGPGLGALTERLLLRSMQLKLIELDADLVSYWRSRGVETMHLDAMAAPWGTLFGEHEYQLVSNLPYQISSTLTVLVTKAAPQLKFMVLMFQKEVAEKVMATVGYPNYGWFSIYLQSHWNIRKLLDASPRDFYPAPQVASRVLVFERAPSSWLPSQEEDARWLLFLKSAFQQRRKFLIKNLKMGYTGLPQTTGHEKVFTKLGLSLKVRAEELSLAQFQAMYLEFFVRSSG